MTLKPKRKKILSHNSDLGSKLLQNPGALCNMVRRIALEAGEVTLEYFDMPGDDGVEAKDDGSPVTKADREAEALIQAALLEITPGVPFVGEEASAGGRVPDLSGHDYFWLVDPLDGTREFIAGSDEFTVNIALIKAGEPLLGVVYAPATGILYAAHGPESAVRWSEESGKDKPISVRPLPRDGLTVISSKAHGSNESLLAFLERFKVKKTIKRGSSLKICAIAEGRADLYPRFGRTCEWDTAAGDAVLRAAGGVITDMDGQALRYGGLQPGFYNPEFVASSFDCFEE